MNKTTNKYSPEVRERAVRMVLDNPGQHESRDPPPLKWSSAMFRRTEETHGKQATEA